MSISIRNYKNKDKDVKVLRTETSFKKGNRVMLTYVDYDYDLFMQNLIQQTKPDME